MGAGAFAEQEPGAALGLAGARVEVGAQSGETGAVADEDQGRRGVGAVEAAVGAYAHVDGLADGQVAGEPAGGEAGRSVRAGHAADDELGAAGGGQAGDGVFATAGGGWPSRAGRPISAMSPATQRGA